MSDMPLEQSFVDVHYEEPLQPEFVIADLIPVGLTILSGPPKKAFKSLQAILMACMCARWPVKAFPPWIKANYFGPSLLFSYEARAGVVNHIITKDLQIETQPGALFVAHNPYEFQLDDPDKANLMLDYMEDKAPILALMDPWRNMHSADENDSGAVSDMLGPLVAHAHENGMGIVLIHHVNKPSEGKDKTSFYTMRGSSALPGLADGLITVEDTKDEGTIWLNTTFKRGLSYRRQIHLGVPGFGWGDQGYEVMDEATKRVQTEWERNRLCPPLQASVVMAATLHLSAGQVKESMDMLERNKFLKPVGEWNRANIP